VGIAKKTGVRLKCAWLYSIVGWCVRHLNLTPFFPRMESTAYLVMAATEISAYNGEIAISTSNLGGAKVSVLLKTR